MGSGECSVSVVGCQWSVVSGQWSVVGCQCSVVSVQWSVVSCGGCLLVVVCWWLESKKGCKQLLNISFSINYLDIFFIFKI